jgi:sialate O-acetylesterase
MAFTMGTPLADKNWKNYSGIDVAADIADSINYPDIRLTTIGDLAANDPIEDFAAHTIKQPWTRASPTSIGSGVDVMGNGHFSAVCYYYGRGLHQRLGVPIGLLHASWGGSSVEDWLDKPTLQPPTGGTCPGAIGGGCCGASPMKQYNGMISPLQRTVIKGAIWYSHYSTIDTSHAAHMLLTCYSHAAHHICSAL